MGNKFVTNEKTSTANQGRRQISKAYKNCHLAILFIGNPAGIGKGTGFRLRERDRDGIGLGHYRLRATF